MQAKGYRLTDKEYKVWPIELATAQQRPELEQLTRAGYLWRNPAEVVELFEAKVAQFAGSKYAVAVDCCSHGIFLALKYLKAQGEIIVPSRTYISVPTQVLHAGCWVKFEDYEWSGVYQLKPYPIWDGAVRWQNGMYQGGFHVLSFQIKKRIPIGRGGMILTDDKNAYDWLKRARHDGRTPGINFIDDTVSMLGYHYYMTPEDAARGILLMDQTAKWNEDSGNQNSYTDLSGLGIFK
jgi:dTDP-4-amino-4,6-dideoxygalactose transaminase